MYFIEILRKVFKNKDFLKSFWAKKEPEKTVSDSEKCEHMFVPIDSTNKVFACYNCGLVIKGKPKNINFFEGDK